MPEFIIHCLYDCRCQLFVNALQKRPKKATKEIAYETALFSRSDLCPSSGIGKHHHQTGNADMDDASQKRGKLMAKKLDIKNDRMINLEELTSRLSGDGMIDKTEFNGRIVAMFEKMDSNGDGSLDDKEINKIKRHHYGKMKNKTGGYSN